MSINDVVPYAQSFTAVIATAALGVAFWSLQAQKAVARRRAAVDFFLKTDLDEKLLEAYSRYRTAAQKLPHIVDFGAFCTTTDFDDIRGYLNVVELMAVGVLNETFDERICYVYWKDFVMRVMSDTAKLIDYLREIDGEHSYSNFRRVHYYWMTNPELAIRWEQGGRPLRKGPTLTAAPGY
ncbi:DUF4760 domain-containing protein [Tardiphaga sp.]|uniref:DUF4760 domain-containing protein n=1 Tax=Tardiphaga sp. TaxID=1926292 RepID=UPI00261D594D|nr:DUF4760 domain-containing protein [Tardiphaga sp.]MDB5617474.1 hypothetical protein [Tardiphaga sp.]